jgi:hypothetical protein
MHLRDDFAVFCGRYGSFTLCLFWPRFDPT